MDDKQAGAKLLNIIAFFLVIIKEKETTCIHLPNYLNIDRKIFFFRKRISSLTNLYIFETYD